MKKQTYIFSAELWLYPTEVAAPACAAELSGTAGRWHFITLPKKDSEDIKTRQKGPRRGWGSVPVLATIGKTTWKTSIFPDKRYGAYVLPVKVAVRMKEGLRAGKSVRVHLVTR